MRDRVLLEAEFDPRVMDYWLLSGVIVLVVTLFGAPLAVIWYFAGRAICQKWLDRMSVRLTTRSLKIDKGWLNRIETTVPLDKITDLAIYQGPIMRALGIWGIRVETAGQGAGIGGAAVVGVKDCRGFRDRVLEERDRVVGEASDRAAQPAPAAPELTGDEAMTGALLTEMRDSLLRIEAKMDQR
jgi:putative membrane protein